MARVTLADDTHNAASANYFAVFADRLDAGSHLHFSPHRQFVAELSSITLFKAFLKKHDPMGRASLILTPNPVSQRLASQESGHAGHPE